MSNDLEVYLEIQEYVDNTDHYENSTRELRRGHDRFLIVSEKGIDGQQLLFRLNNRYFEYWGNETIIDSIAIPTLPPAARPRVQVDSELALVAPEQRAPFLQRAA